MSEIESLMSLWSSSLSESSPWFLVSHRVRLVRHFLAMVCFICYPLKRSMSVSSFFL
jgi:hypothetical protein